jgi:hypothetical protein
MVGGAWFDVQGCARARFQVQVDKLSFGTAWMWAPMDPKFTVLGCENVKAVFVSGTTMWVQFPVHEDLP